jgi:hypothetical protein
MKQYTIWYKDQIVGTIWFSRNVSGEEMFEFLAKIGVQANFLMDV